MSISTPIVGVLPFEQALVVVEQHARALTKTPEIERAPLLETRGRVLASPVRADRDQPGFNRATRDGYAVRAADLAGNALRIVGQVRAGERWESSVGVGEAVQIMTGAPVPIGADAVVMVEHVDVSGSSLRLAAERSLKTGENIVPRGSEARNGMELLSPGTEMGAAEIALAAACGYAELQLTRRPRVAIIATGDELVEVNETPSAEQIRNSNSYGIAALVDAAGAQPIRLVIARDTREDMRARILEGRAADLLVFSGGVSMGDYDLVEEVLAEFNAEFLFTGVKMQPGKPVVFGRLPARDEDQPARYFFGLPGNPISTQVTFHCFVEPFLRAMAGQPWTGPRWALARLSASGEGKGGLVRLLPGRMDGTEVRVLGWHGSGDMATNARANCYVELTQDREAGEIVRVLLREGR